MGEILQYFMKNRVIKKGGGKGQKANKYKLKHKIQNKNRKFKIKINKITKR